MEWIKFNSSTTRLLKPIRSTLGEIWLFGQYFHFWLWIGGHCRVEQHLGLSRISKWRPAGWRGLVCAGSDHWTTVVIGWSWRGGAALIGWWWWDAGLLRSFELTHSCLKQCCQPVRGCFGMLVWFCWICEWKKSSMKFKINRGFI